MSIFPIKNSLLGLLFAFILVSGGQIWAELPCKKAIIGQIKVANQNMFGSEEWHAVEQCHGTCVFESTVAHVENILSQKLGKPIIVSRLYLFSRLIKQRISQKTPLLAGWLGGWPQVAMQPNGKKIIDGANGSNSIFKLMQKNGLVVYEGKDKDSAHVHNEDDALEELYDKIDKLISQFEKGEFSRWTFKAKVEEILEEAVKKELELNGNFKIIDIKSFRKKSPLFFRRKTLERKIIETIDSKQTLLINFITRDYDFVRNNGLYQRAPFDLKDFLMGNRGGHQVLITGYIANDAGSINYLLIRNSWGDFEGVEGYFLMPMDIVLDRVYSIEHYEIEIH